jgi:hypothetical protein
MAIAAVTILFALGPIIVNQGFAYGGVGSAVGLF